MSRYYFDECGNFGGAESLVVVDTAIWSAADWDLVESASDWERAEIAEEIAAGYAQARQAVSE